LRCCRHHLSHGRTAPGEAVMMVVVVVPVVVPVVVI
jgi:hypothetical protein